MEQRLALGSAAILLVAAWACGGSTEQEITAPGGVSRCQMMLAPSPLPAAGGQFTALLSTSRDCTWSVDVSSPWLTVAPATGQGETTLTLTASENPQGRTRTTTIGVNDQRFAVTQSAQTCRFEVAPAGVTVPQEGGRVTIQVITLDGCSWTTQASQPWVRVVSGSGGDASRAVELTVDSNRGEERVAVLTIAGMRVTVMQDAGSSDRNECQYSLGPGAQTFTAAGGNGTFRISTMAQCSWGASSTQPWITVLSSGNGFGPAEIRYRVDPNPATTTRSGAITVGTRRHVVTQQAAPRP